MYVLKQVLINLSHGPYDCIAWFNSTQGKDENQSSVIINVTVDAESSMTLDISRCSIVVHAGRGKMGQIDD